MSIFTKKKPAAEFSGLAQLEKDLSAAVAAAERRNVPPHAIVSALERAEQAERSRLTTTHRFGPVFVSGNLPD